MHPFRYHRPTDHDDAHRRLAELGAAPLGGGTDLLVCMKEEVLRPAALVDLRALPGIDTITFRADGSARLGAGARVHDLATHPELTAHFPALAEACGAVGTPALRNMGTLGGNLCQRPRCWYFRRNVSCLKNGGTGCPAEHGENQYHAILDGGPCFIVHPSDPAVALTALEATVEIASASGTRTLPIAEFYLLPRERLDHETVLAAGEWVSAVELPAGSAGGWQRYYKAMQRGAWDFALVSLAATRRQDGEVRFVFGGVAPRPWRVYDSIEEDAKVGNLDAADVETLAERALYDAAPLEKNGYKVTMATALLRQAIRDMWAA